MTLRKSLQFGAVCFLFALAACSGSREPTRAGRVQSGSGGYYKIGKPYQIKGEWYYPKEDYSYDESGIASWYGADFHDQMTANGEMYNKNELTAAHKTLPLPTLARVTNLENGRSIVVRINDRGPFSGARVIDVSQRSAQLLGFERSGTAKVRVQVLADESKAIADAMRAYGGPTQETQAVAQVAQQPRESVQTFESAPAVSVQSAPLDPVATEPSQPSAVPTSAAQVRPVAQYVQLPVSGPNLIYVQAGAFTSSANATKLTKTLAKLGAARVVEADVKGTRYYRVRLGPIDSVTEADKLLKRVKAAGSAEARIVVD